jgi:hypothetical protein
MAFGRLDRGMAEEESDLLHSGEEHEANLSEVHLISSLSRGNIKVKMLPMIEAMTFQLPNRSE